ncbi:MAG: DUF4012 domain-containing protein, partial [Acidimicrobiales bacterium]
EPSRRSVLRRVWLAVAALVAAAIVVVVVAGLASIGPVRAAYHDLLGAKDALASATGFDLGTVATAAGRKSAEHAAGTAAADAAAAEARIRGSVGLDVLRYVPWLSDQRRAALSLAGDAHAASATAVGVLRAADTLVADARAPRTTIPLAGLAQLGAATRTAAATYRRLDRPPSSLALSQLADARRRLDKVATEASTRLEQAGRTLGALSTFLGAKSPQHDLVAIENNAEMRDQGIVTSYAAVTLHDGKVDLGAHGSVGQLRLSAPVPLTLPRGTQIYFGDELPRELWQSVNSSADFPLSGRLMTAMYAKSSGRRPDGVIAVDVPALADMLAVTGPVHVPGLPQVLTATDAAPVLLDQLYQKLPLDSQTPVRYEILSRVVTVVFKKVEAGGYNPLALGQALVGAVDGGHLRLYSADPSVEAVLAAQPLGGGPATTLADRTFHLAVENATATKLDWFVRPSVSMHVHLEADGTAVVATTVTVRNGAPTDAQPSYQFGPQEYQSRAGQYLARVYFWGPAASRQANGTPESGLELSEGNVLVNPGDTTTVSFTTTVPHAVRDGELQLRLVPQPRAFPVGLSVSVDAPGWRVTGPTTADPTWDHTIVLSWAVRRP